MENLDSTLLSVYMRGFNDELDNTDSFSLVEKAYYLGKLNALLGDDVRSVDYQSDKEILNQIKQ
jgi:hypothetical protein